MLVEAWISNIQISHQQILQGFFESISSPKIFYVYIRSARFDIYRYKLVKSR